MLKGRNRKDNRYIDTPKGKMLLCEAAEISGLKRETIAYRIKTGVSTENLFDSLNYSTQRKKTHGLSKLEMYPSWGNMRNRCENIKNSAYKNYGGRGITVCKEWKKFENFYRDMFPTWRPGLKLERIDTNGNYCRENCTWENSTGQARNMRSNRYIDTPKGKMLTSVASEISGIGRRTIMWRVDHDWPVNRLFDPPRSGRK